MKGFTKLTIQIALLSISMITLSFLTDTGIWLEYFNYTVDGSTIGSVDSTWGIGCDKGSCYQNVTIHKHWNYRGVVYVLSGFVFFIISVVKIVMSHKEEDFK